MYTLAIKKFRKLRHLSLEQLSELCGVSVSHLSRLEADNVIRSKTTTLLTLEKISLAMNACPRDIIWYNCSECQLADNCPKNKDKIDIDDLIEENLAYYI